MSLEFQNSRGSIDPISEQAESIVNFARLEQTNCPNKFKINVYSNFVVTSSNEKSCVAYLIQLIAKGITECGKSEDSLILQVHLGQFNLKAVRNEFLISTIRLLQLIYPNCLHQCYLINAPYIFKSVYELVSNIIYKNLRQKIKFIQQIETTAPLT
jgi:hypothetical protein